MKRLIAGLVAVLMLTPSLCYASIDKPLHASVSGFMLAHKGERECCRWK